TGLAGARSNVELNLAYVLPSVSDRFATRCVAACPPEVDVGERRVEFLGARERTLETGQASLLPSAVGLALFRPSAKGDVLLLEIGPDAPRGFRIVTPEGEPLLLYSEWQENRSAGPLGRPWTEVRPPSHLLVCWKERGGAAHEAVWVVNVTDAALLPPPEELRSLRLEELLEILTSARPLWESVARPLARRGKGEMGPIVDPLEKVDTKRFLLRRMQRVARALEGLRARLERPAASLDGLRWRLRGPVGPIALAQRLIDEDKVAAAFLLAEV